MGTIDKHLNFVRLGWYRTDSEKYLLPGKIFGICTVGSVRGSVRLLREDDAHKLLDESVLKKQELLSEFDEEIASEDNCAT